MLGFNNMSTLVGHFVSSPREKEKRDWRDSRGDERKVQRRRRKMNESEETGETRNVSIWHRCPRPGPSHPHAGILQKNRSNFGEVDVAPAPQLPPADLVENMCKVSKRPALNYMRLQSQGTHCLFTSEVSKWQSSKSTKKWQKYGKDYMKSTCTSSDYGENMCKVKKK